MLLPAQTRRKAVNTLDKDADGPLVTVGRRRRRAGNPIEDNGSVTSHPASQALFDRARTVSPGGVNSPVRAFRAVGGTPIFMRSGSGAWLTDVDGNRYVDLVG